MDLGRLELARARTEKLSIGQSLPQVQELLGDPHENGKNSK